MSNNLTSSKIPYLENWKNYGDIDYMGYGGCMVKSHWTANEINDHPDFAAEYDVFYFNPEVDPIVDRNGNEIPAACAALYVVNVMDFEDKKEELLYSIGEEDKSNQDMLDIMPGDIWAKEIVDSGFADNAATLKTRYPSCYDDYISPVKDIEDWMHDLGIDDVVEAEMNPCMHDSDETFDGRENIFDDDLEL